MLIIGKDMVSPWRHSNMKTLIFAVILLLFCGCQQLREEQITNIPQYEINDLRIVVVHDNKRSVTCWVNLDGGGISCLPNGYVGYVSQK